MTKILEKLFKRNELCFNNTQKNLIYTNIDERFIREKINY